MLQHKIWNNNIRFGQIIKFHYINLIDVDHRKLSHCIHNVNIILR